MNGQVVYPSAVPIERRHDRRHNVVVDHPNKKELALNSQFASDVLSWVVPRLRKLAGVPERDDGRLVGFEERADLHWSKTDQAHLLAAEDGAGDAPTFFATVLAALAVAVAPCSMPLAAAFAPRSTPLAAA